MESARASSRTEKEAENEATIYRFWVEQKMNRIVAGRAVRVHDAQQKFTVKRR